ncbi:hypothetical protein cypCar_00038611, partial [Cyprinus carpio]
MIWNWEAFRGGITLQRDRGEKSKCPWDRETEREKITKDNVRDSDGVSGTAVDYSEKDTNLQERDEERRAQESKCLDKGGCDGMMTEMSYQTEAMTTQPQMTVTSYTVSHWSSDVCDCCDDCRI